MIEPDTPLSPAAQNLLNARRSGVGVFSSEVFPASRAEAYRIQDETIGALGPIGGWKVGAKGPDEEPICAPLPLIGMIESGAVLQGPSWQLRGIEVELALRLGRHIGPAERGDLTDIWSAFDAVLPVIEIVETRLADWRHAPALAKLADLQSHGAVVLGTPRQMPSKIMVLSTLEVQLVLDGQVVADTRGGNPAKDLERLLVWLAKHCQGRGQTLRKGQIITTGSCTGMFFAPPKAHLEGRVHGLGNVAVAFLGS